MKVEIELVHGLDGSGLALTVLCRESLLKRWRTQVFKTYGSATHWCWIEDGSSCPHEVWQAWEAYKVKNILEGRPAYTAVFPAKTPIRCKHRYHSCDVCGTTLNRSVKP